MTGSYRGQLTKHNLITKREGLSFRQLPVLPNRGYCYDPILIWDKR
jgi:hypothetical protein